jgi:hypothetical protein
MKFDSSLVTIVADKSMSKEIPREGPYISKAKRGLSLKESIEK